MTARTMGRATRRLVPAALTLGIVAVFAACGGSSRVAADDTTPLVRIDFEGLQDGSGITSTGSLDVTTEMLTANGGTLSPAPGASGGTSGRFPAWDGSAPAQRAVIKVTSRDQTDPLSPRTDDFELGADFRLDTKSEGGSLDNGNNLVQLGLYGDPAQYKLQVDHGHVSCRVKGSTAQVLVTSTLAVAPLQWYSAKCSRSARVVTLTVHDIGSDVTDTRSASAAVGSVVMGPGAPMSVGGKVSSRGKVVTGAADQLNGLLDDVYYSAG